MAANRFSELKKAKGPAEGAAGNAPTKRPSSKASVPVRTAPVRTTVDLSPKTYKELLDLCSDMASRLGLMKVSNADVIRALITEAADSADLREVLRERMSESND